MQVLNTTTNQVENISIVVNGVDAFADLAQVATNNDFTRNDDGDYQADAETIAWWQAKADEYQEMYELIDELKPNHGEKVQKILDDAQGYEFNDYSSHVVSELKAI